MKEKQRSKVFLKIPVGLSGGHPVGWPVTMGIPFAEGVLRNDVNLSLEAGSGGIGLPLQTKVLARWKDGSIRWVLIDFLRPKHQGGKLFLRVSRERKNPAGSLEKYSKGVAFKQRNGHFIVDTGVIRARLSAKG